MKPFHEKTFFSNLTSVISVFVQHRAVRVMLLFFYMFCFFKVSTLWIAPGVTPWMTTLPGAVNAANNPGIRLFYFDRDSLEPTVNI